jgi:hypothetical protein
VLDAELLQTIEYGWPLSVIERVDISGMRAYSGSIDQRFHWHSLFGGQHCDSTRAALKQYEGSSSRKKSKGQRAGTVEAVLPE